MQLKGGWLGRMQVRRCADGAGPGLAALYAACRHPATPLLPLPCRSLKLVIGLSPQVAWELAEGIALEVGAVPCSVQLYVATTGHTSPSAACALS